MAVDGVRATALIDIADETGWPRAALGPGQPGGDLDEISLITEGRLRRTKVLDSRPGHGTLLFVDVDRTRSNIALASLRVGQLAPAILA